MLLVACETDVPRRASFAMEWKPIDALNAELPKGVRVYSGRDNTVPLKAWFVTVDGNNSDIESRIVVSDDTTDNLETVSSFAQDMGAHIVVNGGFFVMNEKPARHAGLLVMNGRLIAPATRSVLRDSSRYEVARAALGFTDSLGADIAWVTSRKGRLYSWISAPDHRPGQPADVLDYNEATPWAVNQAIGAGPVLLKEGEVHVSSDQEVFFGTSIPSVHPRTAVGLKADGSVILMVVDGRQSDSRGVYLEELALLMREAGAVEAMNLDGGGSSTLVVNNTLVNRPAGGTDEREVMSAIAVMSKRQ